MELQFSKQEEAFKKEVETLIWSVFPKASPKTSSPQDVEAWHGAMIDRGWQAYRWPIEHGGTGWDVTQKFIWERATKEAGVHSQLEGMGISMIGPILYGYGNEEQQKKYLPGILDHTTHWCQGYSESGSGSDLASLKTKAHRDGNEYVINGEKVWTSGAHHADMMFCLVRTSQEDRPQKGISFLLLDMKAPGVEVYPIILIDGRHEVNRVVLDAVRTSVSNRIGEEGLGWTYAKGLLTHERTGLAFVGDSIKWLGDLKREAKEIGQDGQSLMEDPSFVLRVADLESELKALEFTELRTIAETVSGEAPGAQSSFLKLKGTDVVQRVTELWVECAGYYGHPFPLEDEGHNEPPVGPDWSRHRMAQYMIARSASIAGGTDEVQRNVLAKHLLGLG
jgi:alkylation response protein AidB-like acyl-CoA dehydrogenase